MPSYLTNQRVREVLGHRLHHILAERCGAGADELERAEVVLPGLPVLGERDHDGRHAEEVRDAVLLHGAHHGVQGETGHDDDGVAALQLAVGDDGEAEDVEHGQEAEKDVGPFPAVVLVRGHHGRRRDEVSVREDDALAFPRRARGVEQPGRVALLGRRAAVVRLVDAGNEVGVERGAGAGFGGGVVEEDDGEAEVGDLGEEFGDGDDEPGAGVGGLLGDLPRGVERVGGAGDGAEGGDGEEADRVEDAVGRDEEDGVAGADARAGGERDGRGEDRGAEAGEGEGVPRGGVHQRERGRARGGAAEEEVDRGQARVGLDARRRA